MQAALVPLACTCRPGLHAHAHLYMHKHTHSLAHIIWYRNLLNLPPLPLKHVWLPHFSKGESEN